MSDERNYLVLVAGQYVTLRADVVETEAPTVGRLLEMSCLAVGITAYEGLVIYEAWPDGKLMPTLPESPSRDLLLRDSLVVRHPLPADICAKHYPEAH